MYEYKVIRIPVSMWSGKPKEDYLAVINEYADLGWRFVQVVPNSIQPKKKMGVEIIFEKKRSEA